MKWIEWIDDKKLVVICATMIGLFAMWEMQSSETVVTAVISGLFGVAVGKSFSEGS